MKHLREILFLFIIFDFLLRGCYLLGVRGVFWSESPDEVVEVLVRDDFYDFGLVSTINGVTRENPDD